MKDRKKYIIISMILLFISLNLLSLATIFYVFEGEIESYKYSDEDEYTSIKAGVKLIDSLPIQINISNEYFSGFDNLSEETRQSIIIAYTIKNKIATYKCGTTQQSICIDKEKLTAERVLDTFNTKTKLNINNIKTYIDDYGNYNVNSSNTSSYYRVSLDDINESNNYRKYSIFYKYKEEKDMYIFYMYEGYYNGNCIPGETIELYDFITGKSVYSSTCSDKKDFAEEPKKDLEGLQLYKYELKKNEDGNLYLYGYNPVKKNRT